MSIELIQTCGACPEQYDARLDGVQVGYLRLRHGLFYVECPDSGGEEVYRAYPEGDGIFEYEERDYYLKFAVDAIQKWLARSSQPDEEESRKPPAPDVEYSISNQY